MPRYSTANALAASSGVTNRRVSDANGQTAARFDGGIVDTVVDVVAAADEDDPVADGRESSPHPIATVTSTATHTNALDRRPPTTSSLSHPFVTN
jgi:hypothetical protein